MAECEQCKKLLVLLNEARLEIRRHGAFPTFLHKEFIDRENEWHDLMTRFNKACLLEKL